MTAFQCTKGCRDPKAKDGLMWHQSVNECPFEEYNPKVFAGRPGKMKAKGHPQTETPKMRVALPAPAGPGITFTDTRAEVTKGQSKPVELVPIDYVVDGPHTKAFCNFCFRVVYFVHVQVDEIAFDWHKHLPRQQFQLSENANMSIELDPRNMYSRGVTWITKNLFQCKNLQAAHSAIDSIIFFEAFGGIAVALIMHYREVYKNSPKLKAKREAKARAKAISDARRAGQVIVTETGATPAGVPIFTASTAGAVG